MKRTLRVLVAIEIALVVTSVIVEVSTTGFLPDVLQAFLAESEKAELTMRDVGVLVVALGVLAVLVAAWIAIWFGARPAKVLYTTACALALPVTALFGPYVMTGVAVACDYMAHLTSGMILGILYFANDEARRPVSTVDT